MMAEKFFQTTILHHDIFFGIPHLSAIENMKEWLEERRGLTFVSIGIEPIQIQEIRRHLFKTGIAHYATIICDNDVEDVPDVNTEVLLKARWELQDDSRVDFLIRSTDVPWCNLTSPLHSNVFIVAIPTADGILSALRCAGITYPEIHDDAFQLIKKEVEVDMLSPWGKKLFEYIPLDENLDHIDPFLREIVEKLSPQS